MTQRYLVVDQLKLNYDGIFDMNALYNLIDSWLFEKSYDKNEKKNEEVTNDDGTKSLFIELHPWRKLSEYARNDLKIRIVVSGLKDVEVEKDGTKVQLNQGKIQIIFNAAWTSDYQNRWNDKPFLFFLEIIYDRYIYGRYTAKFVENLTADLNDLHTKVKNYFNIYKSGGHYKPQWSA